MENFTKKIKRCLFLLCITFWSSFAFAQPANDLCNNATLVSCGDALVGQTTANATDQSADIGCTIGTGVWYQIEGTGEVITFNITNQSDNYEVGLASGSCGNLTNIECYQSVVEIPVFLSEIGTTYYLYIGDWPENGNLTITFDLSVSCAPANDLCNNATLLSCGETLVDQITTNSTDQSAAIGCSSIGAGVWYSIMGTGNQISLAVANANLILEVGLATGNCASLNNISCTQITGSSEIANFLSVLGTTYYIYIGGQQGIGNFDLSVTCLPANDACINATTLNCGDTNISGTTTGATDDNPTTCGLAGDGNSGGVWYTIVGDGNEMTITVDPNPAGNANGLADSQVAVYSGSCGALVCVGGNDQSALGGNGSQYTFTSVLGTTYYFYVDGFMTNSGDFLISLSCPISCVVATATGTADVACPAGTVSINIDLTDLGSATGGVFISNSGTSVVLSATTIGQYIIPGFSVGDGTITIRIQDSPDPNDNSCFTTFDVIIPASCATPPSNDLCGVAAAIAPGDLNVPGTTTDATDNNPGTCGGAGDGASGGVWYTVVGDGNEMIVTVDPNPTGNANDLVDSQVAVYSGSCGALVCVGGNDQSALGGNGSQFTFPSVIGTTYYLYVDGFSTRSGDFLISLSSPIPCVVATATGTADVTCPAGTVSINIDLTDLGSATGGVFIYNNENNIVLSATTIGQYIIPGFFVGDGTITIRIQETSDPNDNSCFTTFDVVIPASCATPSNDLCGVAAAIAPGDINVAGTTTEATDNNPGNCGGAGDGTSGGVWYMMVGNGNEMTVTVDPAPGGNANDLSDSQLAVYSGNCGALVCVGGNDQSALGGDGSQVIFTPVNGTTYYFYVDGFSTNSGDFLISLEGTALPVELLVFDAKAIEKENRITWETASEENTEWHIVERSADGRSEWQEVGRIDAAGFSSKIIAYELLDEQPLPSAYYRLRSVDFDGYVDFSDLVFVERARENGDVKVYPNPTSGMAIVDFDLTQNENVTVTLTDVTGKTIRHDLVSGQRGGNMHTIEMDQLSAGIYFISVVTSFGKTTERILKN